MTVCKSVSVTNQGFSLIEVLCSLAIFAIALLGLLSMQLTAIKNAYSALLHAQAQIQLLNLVGQCNVTQKPDEKSWQKTNNNYFPNSQSKMNGQNADLNFQAYEQQEHLSLRLAC